MATTLPVTPEQIPEIVQEAKDAAHRAAAVFFHDKLGGRDQWACGFAWVTIHGVRGNTRVGRALKNNGFGAAYGGGLQLWDPSKFGCQNVDTLYAGAQAAARVFEQYGFRAYAGLRLD